MSENKNKKRNIELDYWLSDLRYFGALGAFALMVPVVLGGILLLLPASYATDSWEVEGSNGILHVEGILNESACRLDMSSARQEVRLGETGTAGLALPGDRATGVIFELRLLDCHRISARQLDERTGTHFWSTIQPTVRLSFRGVADIDNPQLVKAKGVTGLGLRLLDYQGKDVRLGSRGEPLFLKPGQSILTYSVLPERTPAPLMAGAYRAAVDFQLSYE